MQFAPVPQVPSKLRLVGILTIVSAALNLMTVGTIFIVLLMSLVGVFCLPILILPVALSIWELVYGIDLLSAIPRATRPNALLAGLEIASVMLGGFVGLIVGIVALVLYADPEVQAYFARRQAASAQTGLVPEFRRPDGSP